MVILLLSNLLLFSLYTSNVECKPDYVYHPEANAWFKVHKVTARWLDAFFQCYNEGAVLASPTNEVMLNVLSEMQDKNDIFIGTHSLFSPGQYVSIEGVNVDNMPMTELIQQINSGDGKCLKMNALSSQGILNAVSCHDRLPYICYKNKTAGLNLTPCGTFDGEYKFEPSAGSCYKFHAEPRHWEDANSVCVAEGGYLVVLNNETEARFIYKSNLFMSESIFVGLRLWKRNEGSSRIQEEKKWLSIHGEPMQRLYNKWQEYSNSGDCGIITKTGLLKTVYCDDENYFVCEKDPHNIRFF